MTSTDEWITGAAAVAMLRDAGVADLRVLGVWAGDGLLNARAKVERVAGTIETYKPTPATIPGDFWDELSAKSVIGNGSTDTIETDTPTSRAIPRYFWGELRANTVMADWAAGVFETTTDIDTEEEGWREASWRISGVEFKNEDLQKCLGMGSLSQASARSDRRGILPASAKANDRKYEPDAHKAAEIVRTEGVLPSKAFKRLANQYNDPMFLNTSVEHAIRQAYDLMYDKKGNPHQN
jgi:hypothetical protein